MTTKLFGEKRNAKLFRAGPRVAHAEQQLIDLDSKLAYLETLMCAGCDGNRECNMPFCPRRTPLPR